MSKSWMLIFVLAAMVSSLDAITYTNGPNGINANGLGLTGNSVSIGQVEQL